MVRKSLKLNNVQLKEMYLKKKVYFRLNSKPPRH